MKRSRAVVNGRPQQLGLASTYPASDSALSLIDLAKLSSSDLGACKLCTLELVADSREQSTSDELHSTVHRQQYGVDHIRWGALPLVAGAESAPSS